MSGTGSTGHAGVLPTVYNVNRRNSLNLALVPVILLTILGAALPIPFATMGPGPTFNTLGTEGDQPVVEISGTDVDPTSGNLNMTTVAVRDEMTIVEALFYWISPRQGIVPRESVYPPGVSRQVVQDANQQDFVSSEANAEAAALRRLGYPTVLEVASVASDGPSADILEPGDRILRVAGQPVAGVPQLQEAIQAVQPGDQVTITIARDGVESDRTVTVEAHPDDPSRGFLGIVPALAPDVDFTIDFNLADVGGPSAGLMFALAVVDKLSPGELTGGKFIAGTGTIDSDGNVGPIGGIRYKIIAAADEGATVFLVPSENCAEAVSAAPDGVRLVKVDTLDGAVDALDALDAGQDAPSCPS